MEAILNILNEIRADIGGLKVDVGELKANMLQLNTDVGGLTLKAICFS